MKEELVSFETAKLLKEKGFSLSYPSACYYNNELWISENLIVHGGIKKIDDNYRFKAPTQSLAQRWLREKHEIDIFVIPSFAPIYNYCNSERNIEGFNLHERIFDVYESCIFKNRKMIYHATSFDLYEEALEEGLKEGLKLIE